MMKKMKKIQKSKSKTKIQKYNLKVNKTSKI